MREWAAGNREAIAARLAPVKALADGVLYRNERSANDVLVYKRDGVVYLYFHAHIGAEIQSRLVLDEPLHLLSPYTQMMMLALLWTQAAPQRMCIIGYGGGRMPMVLHHMLPQLRIDCVEIDAEVVSVAERFFGAAEDERLHVHVGDGRGWLEAHDGAEPYDIIAVDAFLGTGSGPKAFATMEFFALCRQKLTADGVVMINSLSNDTENGPRRAAILDSFPLVMALSDDEMGNQVLFCCNRAEMTVGELGARAKAHAAGLGLSFSLEELAERVEVLSRPAGGVSGLRDTDGQPRKVEKIGRNDPCPCGSLKKYKKCCG